MGDAAGIGPEVTARMLLNHPELRQIARFVVIGDVASMRKAAQQIGHDGACVQALQTPAQVRNQIGTIEVLQAATPLDDVVMGQLNAQAGAMSAQAVMLACDLARQGQIAGIVTAPLNKEAMHMGGYDWPGHTELLAHEFGVKDFSLVLSAEDIYVFHATTHVPMRQAVLDCTAQRFDSLFELIYAFQRALGREQETIAVAGLNPHAGENGLFGDEELNIIAPAIARAQAKGIHTLGPIPGDVLWPKAVREKAYKFLVCCYHDQGHGPFKAVYGDEGVNITVGLPVVRVSVDHGTAFDIAGKNIARETSLMLAAKHAARLAPNWAQVWAAAQRA